MPLFEFECNDCHETFDDIVPMSKAPECPDTVCSHCQSKNWTKLMSTCNHAFSNPVGTQKWDNAQTGHDYRFKTNAPHVKAEREMAQRLSHMGADPYKDTSKKDIELDTGVHDAKTRKGLS